MMLFIILFSHDIFISTLKPHLAKFQQNIRNMHFAKAKGGDLLFSIDHYAEKVSYMCIVNLLLLIEQFYFKNIIISINHIIKLAGSLIVKIF